MALQLAELDRDDTKPLYRDVRAVGWGVFLGLEAGFVGGLNFTLAGVLIAAIMLRVRLRTFAVAWCSATALAYLSLPITFYVGRYMLDDTAIGHLVATLGSSLWAGLLGWDQYSVMGGAAVGTPASLIAALVGRKYAANLLERRAAGLLQVHARGANENLTVYVGSLRNTAADWIAWALFGTPQSLGDTSSESGMSRPKSLIWRLTVAGGVSVLAGSGPWWLAPPLVERALLQSLSTANRAEVNAQKIKLDFVGGKLEITDLEVADPENLERDRVWIGKVSARFNPGALLRGRLEIDDLAMADVEQDVLRARRAKAYGASFPSVGTPWVAAGDEGPTQDGAISIPLCNHVRDWDGARKRMHACKCLLSQIETVQSHELDRAPGDAEVADALPLAHIRSQRSCLGTPAPKILVKRLRAEGFSGSDVLGQRGTIQVANLCSRPDLIGEPTKVEIVSPESATEVRATLNFQEPGAKHEVEFATEEQNLAELIDHDRPASAVVARVGNARLVGRGTLEGQRLEVDVDVELSNLDAQVVCHEPVAGLSPQVWNQGLAQMSELKTRAKLVGELDAPRLEVDPAQLVRDYSIEVDRQGDHALVETIYDEQRFGPQQTEDVAATHVDRAPTAENPWPWNQKPAATEGGSEGIVEDDAAETGVGEAGIVESGEPADPQADDAWLAADAQRFREGAQPWPAKGTWEPVPPVMARSLYLARRGSLPLELPVLPPPSNLPEEIVEEVAEEMNAVPIATVEAPAEMAPPVDLAPVELAPVETALPATMEPVALQPALNPSPANEALNDEPAAGAFAGDVDAGVLPRPVDDHIASSAGELDDPFLTTGQQGIDVASQAPLADVSAEALESPMVDEPAHAAASSIHPDALVPETLVPAPVVADALVPDPNNVGPGEENVESNLVPAIEPAELAEERHADTIAPEVPTVEPQPVIRKRDIGDALTRRIGDAKYENPQRVPPIITPLPPVAPVVQGPVDHGVIASPEQVEPMELPAMGPQLDSPAASRPAVEPAIAAPTYQRVSPLPSREEAPSREVSPSRTIRDRNRRRMTDAPAWQSEPYSRQTLTEYPADEEESVAPPEAKTRPSRLSARPSIAKPNAVKPNATKPSVAKPTWSRRVKSFFRPKTNEEIGLEAEAEQRDSPLLPPAVNLDSP